MSETSAYGLWSLVILNSLVFVIFAFSFARPQSVRDWRSFGAFSAFLVALFTEMYGFPLTIYLLSGWLQSRYPGVDWFAHDSGHLLEMLLGWKANPHFGPFHLLSFALIGGGFWLLADSWKVLYAAQGRASAVGGTTARTQKVEQRKERLPRMPGTAAAQRTRTLAVTGPYARIRHPQYVGFVLIMLGFLVQWPTVLTFAMFPVLVYMYVSLARREEREVASEFGEQYIRYASQVPAFFPRLGVFRRGTHRDDRRENI